MPLSEDAKNELKEAIRIVREDRFGKYAVGILSKYAHTDTPTNEPEKDPNMPPKKDVPPQDTPPVKKSGYWGELLDD